MHRTRRSFATDSSNPEVWHGLPGGNLRGLETSLTTSKTGLASFSSSVDYLD